MYEETEFVNTNWSGRPVILGVSESLSPKRGQMKDRYEVLKSVYAEAVHDASHGKGRERHDPLSEPFEHQEIVRGCELLGSNHGAIFQARKKAAESVAKPYHAARRELLGALNYLAAAIIVLDRAEAASQSPASSHRNPSPRTPPE